MGVVKYATGIQYVKGALSKPVKKENHTHGTYLIGTHREAETTNPNCTRLYVRDEASMKRTTLPSTDELLNRARFQTVAAAVLARSKDLSKITQDQQDFAAQKDLANGKKTMKAYLWSLELAAYDEAHS